MIKREMTVRIIKNRLPVGILFGILWGVILFVTIPSSTIHAIKQKMQELIDREDGINVPASESRTDVKPINKPQPGQDNLPEQRTPEELLPP